MKSAFSGKRGKIQAVCLNLGKSSGQLKNDKSDTMLIVIEGEGSIWTSIDSNILHTKEHPKASAEHTVHPIKKDDAVFIPKGTEFEIKNDSKEGKKHLIYTLITGDMKPEDAKRSEASLPEPDKSSNDYL